MTYDFNCPKCKKNYEIKESMEAIDRLKPICPDCSVEMKRVYNPVGIIYKATGFTKAAKRPRARDYG